MFYMALMRLRKCIFLHTVSPSKIHNSCIIFHISRLRKLAISNEKAAEKNIKEIATGILDKPETDKATDKQDLLTRIMSNFRQRHLKAENKCAS